MIYTPQTRKALLLACQYLTNLQDRGGIPLIAHVLDVADRMEDEKCVTAALLAWVPNGTDLQNIRTDLSDFDPEAVEAAGLLRRRRGTGYFSYIASLKHNEIARKVKLADLMSDADPGRLDVLDLAARMRLEKYQAAMELLQS